MHSQGCWNHPSESNDFEVAEIARLVKLENEWVAEMALSWKLAQESLLMMVS